MTQLDSTKYVPMLDGIRGIAILAVIVCHTICCFVNIGGTHANEFQRFIFFVFGLGGFGVDLFFVLSGYLITGILINAREKENYYLNFYARRTLRIFPLYYLYITLVIFILPILIPYMRDQINGNLGLYYLYLQNFVPFANNTLPEYLFGHLWSLAVEEHFYLIWPLIVYKVNDRKIFLLGLAVIIGAVLFRCYFIFLSGFRPGVIDYYSYRFTFCRADALMLGAILAFVVRNETLSRLMQYHRLTGLYGSGLTSIVLLIYAFGQGNALIISNKVISSIGYTIFSIFFTFLLFSLLNATRESFVSRFFNNTVMRFFGKYSYAMYIVHFPLIAFIYANYLENFNCKPMTKVLILFVTNIILTSVISWLIYHLIEKHFLSLKRFFVSERREPKLDKIVLEEIAGQ